MWRILLCLCVQLALASAETSFCDGDQYLTGMHGYILSVPLPSTTGDLIDYNCSWTITGRRGLHVRLHFKPILLRQSKECQPGGLIVYDGPSVNSTEITKLCASNVVPAAIYSSGQSLTLKYTAATPRPAFNISYRVLDTNISFCDGQQVLHGNRGVILSHPSAGNSLYSGNLECSWVISEPSKIIDITFDVFHLESHEQCEYDSLTVREGDKDTGREIKKLCGFKIPRKIYTASGILTLIFKADKSKGGYGFQITYRMYKKKNFGMIQGKFKFFDGVKQCAVRGGKIAVIQTMGDQEVATEATKAVDHPGCKRFSGAHSGCLAMIGYFRRGRWWHWHRYHYGVESNFTHWNPFKHNLYIRSSAVAVLNRFKSNDSWNNVDLDKAKFSVLCEFPEKGFSICRGNLQLHEQKGVISSHPLVGRRFFVGHQNCSWTITGRPYKLVLLDVSALKLAKSPNCENESLTVYDGPEDRSKEIRRLCGTSRPDILSTGQSLTLRFYSRSLILDKNKGFWITYRVIDNHSGCGGKRYFRAKEGVILSHPAAGRSNYTNNVTCLWTILVPPGKGVKLHFDLFSVENSSACYADVLTVNITIISSVTTTRFCGYSTPDDIYSAGRTVGLRFKSDHSIGGKGFRIRYKLIENTGCGSRRELSEEEGIIVKGKNPNERDCSWTITGRPGKVVNLNFTYLRINCDYNDLIVRDGLRKIRMCSYVEDHGLHIISTGQRVHLSFVKQRMRHWDALRTFPSRLPRHPRSVIRNKDGRFMIIYKLVDKKAFRMIQGRFSFGEAWNQCFYHGGKIATFRSEIDRELAEDATKADDHPGCKHLFECVAYIGLTWHTNKERQWSVPNSTFENWVHHSTHKWPNDCIYLNGFKGRSRLGYIPCHNKMSVLCEFPENESSVCEGNRRLTREEGIILSHSLANRSNFEDNRNCTITIPGRPGKVVYLRFIEKSLGCESDGVTVFDGLDDNSREIKRQCNAGQPENIFSNGQSLTLKFNSKNLTTETRFQINYKIVNKLSGCGGDRYLLGEEGVIHVENRSSAATSLSCMWVIVGRPDKEIRLHFLDPVSTPGCRRVMPTMYDGPDDSSKQIKILCNPNKTPTRTQTDIFSTGQSLTLKFRTDGNRSSDGFKVHYKVTDGSGCGGERYLREEKGYILSHPTFGNGTYYSNLLNCKWTVTGRPKKVVHLLFKFFDVEHCHECNCDILTIYDGPNEDSRVIERRCDKVDNLTIESTGQSLTLKFVSDGAEGLRGFRIFYKLLDAKKFKMIRGRFTFKEAQSMCIRRGGKIAVIENKRQLEHALVATTDIHRCPKNRKYRCISYIGFTRKDTYSRWHWIGGNSKFTYWHAWEPKEKGEVCTSLNYYDDTWDDAPCSFKYSALCEFPWSEASICKGNRSLNEEEGVIVSRSFANISYSESFTCTQTISGRRGKIVYLHFNILSLKNNSKCENGSLTVYDGQNNKSRVIKRLCGSDLPEDIYSSGQSVTLTFKSRKLPRDTGFWISYKLINNNTTDCEEGRYLRGEEGSITIKPKPGRQGSVMNRNCMWTITGRRDKIVELHFETYRTQGNKVSCRRQNVTVYNGLDDTGTVLTTKCGNETSSYAYSSGQSLTLKSYYDKPTTNVEFRIRYKVVEPSGCGGGRYLRKESGIIFSHLSYGNGPYPNNTNCMWVIPATRGKVVKLEFTNFRLNGCNGDSLIVYNGTGNTTKQAKRFCGRVPRSNVFYSSGQGVTLRFTTDKSGRADGFRLNYSFIEARVPAITLTSGEIRVGKMLQCVADASPPAKSVIFMKTSSGRWKQLPYGYELPLDITSGQRELKCIATNSIRSVVEYTVITVTKFPLPVAIDIDTPRLIVGTPERIACRTKSHNDDLSYLSLAICTDTIQIHRYRNGTETAKSKTMRWRLITHFPYTAAPRVTLLSPMPSRQVIGVIFVAAPQHNGCNVTCKGYSELRLGKESEQTTTIQVHWRPSVRKLSVLGVVESQTAVIANETAHIVCVLQLGNPSRHESVRATVGGKVLGAPMNISDLEEDGDGFKWQTWIWTLTFHRDDSGATVVCDVSKGEGNNKSVEVDVQYKPESVAIGPSQVRPGEAIHCSAVGKPMPTVRMRLVNERVGWKEKMIHNTAVLVVRENEKSGKYTVTCEAENKFGRVHSSQIIVVEPSVSLISLAIVLAAVFAGIFVLAVIIKIIWKKQRPSSSRNFEMSRLQPTSTDDLSDDANTVIKPENDQ